MASLYPLRMRPLLKRYLWGGRQLGERLGKPLDDGNDYAESWEVCDHGQDQTTVLEGPLEGWTLRDLVRRYTEELLGRHAGLATFPLLFKFLDAQHTLSVQVHPDDERAALLEPPDLGKTEAWVVLAADPGAVVYAGLKRGFDRPALERELSRGTCELCLNRLEVRAGDCIFLPAGIVHALGAGLLIAEVQQSSNTTYRLFDWNRTGPDGRPRALHIEQALEVIDFSAPPVAAQVPQATERDYVHRLVACDKFVLDRWNFCQPQGCGGDNRFHLVAVLEGAVQLRGVSGDCSLGVGQTLLVPAVVGEVELRPAPSVTLLDIYLP